MPAAGTGDKAVADRRRRTAAAVKRVAAIRDRRRFKETPVPTGQASRVASARATGTIFPNTVAEPTPGEAVLKDGACGACWSTDRTVLFVEH